MITEAPFNVPRKWLKINVFSPRGKRDRTYRMVARTHDGPIQTGCMFRRAPTTANTVDALNRLICQHDPFQRWT